MINQESPREQLAWIKAYAVQFTTLGGMESDSSEAIEAHDHLAGLVDAFPHHAIACNAVKMRVAGFMY